MLSRALRTPRVSMPPRSKKSIHPTVSRMVLACACALALLTGCGQPGPELIEIRSTNLFPEGLDYSPRYGVWLTTSFYHGRVVQIKDDGTIKPLITDDEILVSTIGLKVDERRDRVLVVNSDPGYGARSGPDTLRKLAGLGIYRLSTGERIIHADLGALRPEEEHFANDVAIDGRGNAYVTDSYAGIVYRVDPTGVATVLIENSRFSGAPGRSGLNGIAFHPNNFLVVAKMDEGRLYKIPLSNPDNFQEIELDRRLTGADGLFWNIAGDLVVNANRTNDTVFLVRSVDGWNSARVVGQRAVGDVFVTTGVLRGSETYVLFGRLNRLFGGELPVEDFRIKKIRF